MSVLDGGANSRFSVAKRDPLDMTAHQEEKLLCQHAAAASHFMTSVVGVKQFALQTDKARVGSLDLQASYFAAQGHCMELWPQVANTKT